MRSNQPDELDKLLDEALASYSREEPRPGLEQRVVSRVQAEGVKRGFGWWRWAVAVPVFASLLVLSIGHRAKSQHGAAAPDSRTPEAALHSKPGGEKWMSRGRGSDTRVCRAETDVGAFRAHSQIPAAASEHLPSRWSGTAAKGVETNLDAANTSVCATPVAPSDSLAYGGRSLTSSSQPVSRSIGARPPLPRRAVFPLPAPLSPEERALVDLVARFPDQAREALIEASQRSSQPIEIRRIEIPPLPDGSER